MTEFTGFLILLIFLLIGGSAKAQTDQSEKQIEDILESLSESGDENSENPQVIEDLTNYLEKPLNVNTASESDFEQLHLLDYNQIQNIIDYRKKYGNIVSIHELTALKTFSPGQLKALEPFILFDHSDSLYKSKRAFQKFIFRAKTSFPFSKGYSATSEKKPAAYPGPPVSLYSRYKLEIPKKVEVGFITDNDSGEDFFKESNLHGFDYYSGYISWNSNSIIQQITLGDYYLKFGQGLSFWSGYGMGKSNNVTNILKTGQGIRPYTSTDENAYFRGLATVIGKRSLKLMLFYSSKMRDANLVLDKTSGDTVFTSLKTGGYHRTLSEIEDEKVLREKDMGAYIDWRLNKFKLGALFSYQQFSLDMITGTSAYKAKSFSGNENINAGMDYHLSLNRIQLFGEAGISRNSKMAFLQGLIWHAHPQFNFSFYYRHFDPGFHAFYGNPISEGTEGRNERGLYTGIEFYPFANIKITAYSDFYHFPWLTYSTLAPSQGKDFLCQIDFSHSKNFFFYLRGKIESKPQKFTNGPDKPMDYIENSGKLRLHLEYKLFENLLLKNRIEYSSFSFHNSDENGLLIYQDMNFTLMKKLTLWARYSWFNTDGYNSRIYAYENDLLYSFSIPEFHGKGQRIYLNLKWQVSKNLMIYFKSGRTIHDGAETWGSGNDLTFGNCRTELRGEIYFKF